MMKYKLYQHLRWKKKKKRIFLLSHFLGYSLRFTPFIFSTSVCHPERSLQSVKVCRSPVEQGARGEGKKQGVGEGERENKNQDESSLLKQTCLLIAITYYR